MLVAIAPAGFVTYISSAYPGRISDVDLVATCGILSLLEPGDYIMTDKGFLIRAMLNKLGCDLIMPPKKRTGKEFNSMPHRTLARLLTCASTWNG